MIIANTAMLGLDRYPQNDDIAVLVEKVNIAFSLFMMLEAVLKLYGLGFNGYINDSYNIFDIVIAIASLADILVSNILNHESIGVITTFRGFRLLRIFKLAKQWNRLDMLLRTIKRTLQDVSTFSVLLFLFMFTFALLGMELFGCKVRFDEKNKIDLVNGNPPDANFDSILNSFTTVFIVMTADAWSNIYFNHYRAISNSATTFYFIILVLIG